jgi:hypothetical protein
MGIVETVAHATAALHFFPDADVICDVGGTDVKIMILRQGTVADFRLNSQCSSGNGAFLQGVAERYSIPLESYADRAFEAKAMPTLAIGLPRFFSSCAYGRAATNESFDVSPVPLRPITIPMPVRTLRSWPLMRTRS